MPTKTPRRIRWDLTLAAGITLVFLALNILDATRVHLWYDEGWTLVEITGLLTATGLSLPEGVVHPGKVFQDLVAAPGPFARVAEGLFAQDVHPPVYFQTLWAWAHVFGTSPLALRSLSIAAMTLAATLVFWHSRRATGPAALLALTAMLASPGAAYAAVNARGYGLVLLLVTLGVVAMLRALEGARPRPWMLLAGAATGTAALTHYFALLTLLPAGAVAMGFLLWRRQWSAIAIGLLAAAPGLATALLVWLPQHLGARPKQYAGFRDMPVEALSLFRVFVHQFTPYRIETVAAGVGLSLLGALLLAAFLLQGKRHRSIPSVAVPFAGLFGCLAGLFFLFWATDKSLLSFSVPRYGAFALPCMALLLAQLPGKTLGHRPVFLGLGVAALVGMGVLPRMQGASFDQPWGNHTPSHAAAVMLREDPIPNGSIVVIVGREPGQIGIMLQDLPTGMPVLYAPEHAHLERALRGTAYTTLHMRPVPWRMEANLPFFSPDLIAVIRQAGFSTTDPNLMTWKRDVPGP